MFPARPSPFFECLPHTHAHNLNVHATGEAWNRGYLYCTKNCVTLAKQNPCKCKDQITGNYIWPPIYSTAPWKVRLYHSLYSVWDCTALGLSCTSSGFALRSVLIPYTVQTMILDSFGCVRICVDTSFSVMSTLGLKSAVFCGLISPDRFPSN